MPTVIPAWVACTSNRGSSAGRGSPRSSCRRIRWQSATSCSSAFLSISSLAEQEAPGHEHLVEEGPTDRGLHRMPVEARHDRIVKSRLTVVVGGRAPPPCRRKRFLLLLPAGAPSSCTRSRARCPGWASRRDVRSTAGECCSSRASASASRSEPRTTAARGRPVAVEVRVERRADHRMDADRLPRPAPAQGLDAEPVERRRARFNSTGCPLMMSPRMSHTSGRSRSTRRFALFTVGRSPCPRASG